MSLPVVLDISWSCDETHAGKVVSMAIEEQIIKKKQMNCNSEMFTIRLHVESCYGCKKWI